MRVRDAMQRHVSAIRLDDSLGLAQQLMLWSEQRHLPVLGARDRLVGMISEHDLLCALTTRASAPEALAQPVGDFMSTPLEHVEAGADLATAAARMSAQRLGCLPVIEHGMLIGLLTATDALAALAGRPYAAEAAGSERSSVAAIMYPDPIAVPAHATLLATAARMAERGVRHACVIDAERRVVGIVSDRDVRRLLGHPQRALSPSRVPSELHGLRVDEVMSVPTTVGKDASISHALSLLLSGQFSALPVTDASGRLCGMVSYVGMLRRLREMLAVA